MGDGSQRASQAQYFRYIFCICPHGRQIFWSEGSANTEYTKTQQDTSKKGLFKVEDRCNPKVDYRHNKDSQR